MLLLHPFVPIRTSNAHAKRVALQWVGVAAREPRRLNFLNLLCRWCFDGLSLCLPFYVGGTYIPIALRYVSLRLPHVIGSNDPVSFCVRSCPRLCACSIWVVSFLV